MKRATFIAQAVVNSYSILFFSQNKVLGVLLLAVSFFNPAAGLTGLLGVLFSIAMVSLLRYDRESTRMGFYSFNTLLLGIGFGTFYQFNYAFFIWLGIACIIVTILSVDLASWLSKLGFPLLSFPFIIAFWLLLLAANSLYHMGLDQRNSAILNEMYTAADGRTYHLPGILNFISIPNYLGLFFRALSAVLFQNNIISGIIISVGLLIHSRIHLSLLILAFASACLFNGITRTYPEGMSYYHLGSNIMMAAGAIGSFFLIPSWRSYAWALITIPVTFLMINAFTRVFGVYDLPVLSLPFTAATMLFIWFFKLRFNTGKLQLTVLQHYSPERNLYQYLNGKERLHDLSYCNFSLPFLGVWTVSQGYNGAITHKDDWGNALDFVIYDDEHHTYKYPGNRPEHFYAYNKPVLACGDGIIEEVVTHINDNEIGEVNTIDNWGNSIVIKHLTGLYSKVSHLKKDSVKVKPGDFVKQGDIIGMCGNSGRSPEPHLHFQVQTTPYIGSKTLAYPFAYYINQADQQNKFRSFIIPAEDTVLSPVAINTSLKQAFKLLPGYTATVSAPGKGTERFEVFTDAFNQSYLYSSTTGAIAYFINNGTLFYFTSFYGDKNSLLYYFYLAAYKVAFTSASEIIIADTYPIQLTTDKITLWLHDLLAPFYQFIKLDYRNTCTITSDGLSIDAQQYKKIFGRDSQTMDARVMVDDGTIKAFEVTIDNKQIQAQWMAESTY